MRQADAFGCHSFEIDFVIRDKGGAVPADVKSASNRKAESLVSLLTKGAASRGIKLIAGYRVERGDVSAYPHYLAPVCCRDGAGFMRQM